MPRVMKLPGIYLNEWSTNPMDYCEITKLKNNTYMYWDNGDITEISNIKDTYQPLEEVKEYKKKTINLRRN